MLQPDFEAAVEPADSKATRCLKRAVDDLEEVQIDEEVEETFVFVLLLGVIPPQARVVAPRLQRASARMKAVATGDRILDEGVDAWVEGSDFYGWRASGRRPAPFCAPGTVRGSGGRRSRASWSPSRDSSTPNRSPSPSIACSEQNAGCSSSAPSLGPPSPSARP